MNPSKHTELVNHAWSVADLLRGDFKQSEYGKVILPFTVLRRLETVLEPTRAAVQETVERFKGKDIDMDIDIDMDVHLPIFLHSKTLIAYLVNFLAASQEAHPI